MQTRNLRKIDIKHLWHPYTNAKDIEKGEFPIFTKGKGSYLIDINNKKYIDGISSWWCVNFGHSRKELINAIKEQTNLLQHSIIGNASNDKAIKLAQKLAEITPKGLTRSFFCSDGASGVECALRIARQYWTNQNITHKTKFLSLQDGYHGDTSGCVSVGYIEVFHKELKQSICKGYKANSPHCAKCPFRKHPSTCNAECFQSMEEQIVKHHKELIGVIVEPLCQGAAGIRIYSAKYLKKLQELCKKYNILLIADEIAVGLYRTGEIFASTLANINPDIIILGKALTGGYLPMSAVVTTDKIYNTFKDGKTFYYGHTFSGNPITSNLALNALQLYQTLNIKNTIQPLCKIMEEFSKELGNIIPDSFSNNLGMISMVEVPNTVKSKSGINFAKNVVNKCVHNGLLIRNLHTTLYIWPPLTISKTELAKALKIFRNAIVEELGSM